MKTHYFCHSIRGDELYRSTVVISDTCFQILLHVCTQAHSDLSNNTLVFGTHIEFLTMSSLVL